MTSGNTEVQLNKKLHHLSTPIFYPEGKIVQRQIIILPSILQVLHFQNSSADKIGWKILSVIFFFKNKQLLKKQMRNFVVETLPEFSGLKPPERQVPILSASWGIFALKMSSKPLPQQGFYYDLIFYCIIISQNFFKIITLYSLVTPLHCFIVILITFCMCLTCLQGQYILKFPTEHTHRK